MSPSWTSSFRLVIDIQTVRACLSGSRALILEEDPESFGRMFVSLAAVGCRAALARGWTQAVQMSLRIEPHLIISPSSTANLRPVELLGAWRQMPATHDALVVALVEQESRRERLRLLDLGWDGYLWKPADRVLFATELVRRTAKLGLDARPTAPLPWRDGSNRVGNPAPSQPAQPSQPSRRRASLSAPGRSPGHQTSID